MARRKAAPVEDRDEDFDGESPEAGHNTAELEAQLADELKDLWDQRDGLNAKMADVRKRAKAGGINASVLQAAVKRQREDEADAEARAAFEDEVAAMLARLGEFANTPLGRSAVEARAH
jgi:protein involved in polysaccharide export with SLBB domain